MTNDDRKEYRKLLDHLKKSFVADVVSLKKDTHFEAFVIGILNDASAQLGQRIVFNASSLEPKTHDDN